MSKTAVLLVASLIIFCVGVGQILLSFASYTSTKTIAALGIIKEKVVEPTRIRKHVVAYGGSFTDTTASFVASNFDVVDTGFEAASTIGRIKALNPNIIVLGYRDIMAMHSYYEDWEEVNPHEDWFLHDIHGNRLIHKKWGWYAMDVGNTGWRSHYANFVKDYLDSFPFDGVFADDTWDAWYTYRYEEWTVPPKDIPLEIEQRWHNDMLGMIQTVKSVIGHKLLVLNTQNNDDYVDAADGKMFEHFVHKTSWGLDYYGWPGFDPLEHVDALAEVSSRGKIFLAHSGAKIPDNPTQDDLDRAYNVMLYCFASYLLGVNGEKTTFGFNSVNSKDASLGYYSEFDVPLGSPVNQYYPVGSVYTRDFAYGKVLVNPTTSSYTVDLDSEYKTPDGQTISIVTLDPHSGVILLRP
ncbi:MAG TPA: hypothetical protein HA348_06585 [Thermoplasmata archaeon]|nr:hypothetical protein [Thermoplasmata archaeon]